MRLDDMILDPELQPRTAIDAALLDEYADAVRTGTVLPPVVVFEHGDQRYLADGFYRVHAARAAGLDDIDVDLRPGVARRPCAIPWPPTRAMGSVAAAATTSRPLDRRGQPVVRRSRRGRGGGDLALLGEVGAATDLPGVRSQAGRTGRGHPARQGRRQEQQADRRRSRHVGQGCEQGPCAWERTKPRHWHPTRRRSDAGEQTSGTFTKVWPPTLASTKRRRLLCRSRKRRRRFGEPAASGRGSRNRDPTSL